MVYFLVTRFFRFHQWYLDLFLVTGMLVCGFGITDYFQMDLLHFKEELSADQHATFVSTFGNINTYTVYVGAVLAVSMTLFTLDKDWRKRVWYFAAMMVSSVAIIMGTSDNAYLTLGALLGFLPLYLFRTWSGIRRYLMAAGRVLHGGLDRGMGQCEIRGQGPGHRQPIYHVRPVRAF